MKSLGRYAATAALILLLGVLAAWSFVDADGRTALVVAAAMAFLVQLAAFAGLGFAGGDANRFLAVWGAGVLVRMVLVAAVGLTREAIPGVDPTVLLMALCGFLFALLLLEPVFMSRDNGSVRFAQ